MRRIRKQERRLAESGCSVGKTADGGPNRLIAAKCTMSQIQSLLLCSPRTRKFSVQVWKHIISLVFLIALCERKRQIGECGREGRKRSLEYQAWV